MSIPWLFKPKNQQPQQPQGSGAPYYHNHRPHHIHQMKTNKPEIKYIKEKTCWSWSFDLDSTSYGGFARTKKDAVNDAEKVLERAHRNGILFTPKPVSPAPQGMLSGDPAAQMLSLRCAYADLVGAQQAHEQGNSSIHDWKAHQQTIEELEQVFPFLTN